MADQPLTLAVFEEFQRKIFKRFDALDTADRRFDVLDARIDARADQVVSQIDTVLHRLLALEKRLDRP
jgi:hypothetical protein